MSHRLLLLWLCNEGFMVRLATQRADGRMCATSGSRRFHFLCKIDVHSHTHQLHSSSCMSSKKNQSTLKLEGPTATAARRHGQDFLPSGPGKRKSFSLVLPPFQLPVSLFDTSFSPKMVCLFFLNDLLQNRSILRPVHVCFQTEAGLHSYRSRAEHFCF